MATKKKTIEEQPKSPAELALPTQEAVEAARAKRKDRSSYADMQPGRVLGLPDGWRSAIVDPALPDGQIAALEVRYTGKGWIKLDGLQTVTGYPQGAIVYVKTEQDYIAARKERAQRIEEARRAGLMH